MTENDIHKILQDKEYSMGHIPDPAFCPCGIIVNGGELQKQKEKKKKNNFGGGK